MDISEYKEDEEENPMKHNAFDNLRVCDRCYRVFRDIEQTARKEIEGALVLYICNGDEGEQHIDLCLKCYTELSEWYCKY